MAPKRPVNGAATPASFEAEFQLGDGHDDHQDRDPRRIHDEVPASRHNFGNMAAVSRADKPANKDAGCIHGISRLSRRGPPFNAFLSGFSAAVGQFVLTASLRMQTSGQDAKGTSKTKSSSSKGSATPAQGDLALDAVSPERAFADYVFGSVILHFFCVNFIN
ncbi:hypothetical protein CIRG_04461 [Coccidioides immitis RMSCC 2394]|uniref:Dolichyl-diphosphooligosaccharide--protein glycosyltransferase subunit OST2 n=1 Tax=Coccidioides immitis RMSCC 2394 TaxID=404692 RepID=A0A0J6YAJ3_COCIT|nr:hypothetical protein CIRG_04461 [Coccidioides immitis RMSCC 2394]